MESNLLNLNCSCWLQNLLQDLKQSHLSSSHFRQSLKTVFLSMDHIAKNCV